MARKKIRLGETELDLGADAARPESGGSSNPEPDPPFDLVMANGPVSPDGSVELLGPPSEPVLSPTPNHTPPPQAPVATAVELTLVPLEQRLDRLEHLVTQLGQIQIGQFQRQPPPTAPVATPVPSVLTTAAALVDAGRQLLPSLTIPAGSGGPGLPPGRGVPPGRPWFVRDVLAELQAIYYMYVDPRYHLSLGGKVVPLVLIALFCTSGFWLKYAACGLGAVFQKPIELLICYALFKVLAVEARRYRETAPDLPPSLRL